MAWTNVGFDGTINEAEWSRLSGLLGNSYVAAGNGDCVVTAVPGARSVSVAAGSLYGDGVLSTNSGAETVAMTTPVNGQWYVIALRRTWASNSAALVAIAGATTTTTTPTAPPTSFPTLNTNVGVLTDQPIAWAWCNSANTTVVVYDIRLKAVKSLPPVVANANERDAKFMSPTQGLQVWRDDLGAVETYFGLYNASTNPGGRDSAGWYVEGRDNGMIPMKPSSVTVVTGSATADSLGVVSFTGVTRIQLNGVFTTKYRNYKVLVSGFTTSSTLTDVYAQVSSSGTYLTAGYYQNGIFVGNSVITWAFSNASAWPAGRQGSSGYIGNVEMLITNPAVNLQTGMVSKSTGWSSGDSKHSVIDIGGHIDNTNAYDGISISFSAGVSNGRVQVLGYND